ncbi:MAG: alkaline phosphatase family protein, partial [Candidatus Neomarinimicrobiota bacterium]|nr:alkaline phosphatase family protein [Candidatus Neomarinimicrobiota bacterium]
MLIEDGVFIENAICSINGQPTMSGPGWSTMLTGVWYDKHGVSGNFFRGSKIDQFPPFNILMKKKNKEFKMASFIMWKPLHKRIFKNSEDYYRFFPRYNDDLAVEVSDYLTRSKDDVVFIDFDHVDRAGHLFGFDPENKRYVHAIENVDSYIGLIVKSLENRESVKSEDWLIIITSDHGGLKRKHGGQSESEKTIPIILNGSRFKEKKIERQAYLADIVPTIFEHFQLEVDSSWGFDGDPLIAY